MCQFKRFFLVFSIVFLLASNAVAQSKKVQILKLQNKCDSLSSVLDDEFLKSHKQAETYIAHIDSLKNIISEKEAKYLYLESNFKRSTDSLEMVLQNLNNENLVLTERLTILAPYSYEAINEVDTVLRNQVLRMKSEVTKICVNELSRNKIIAHINKRYEEHLLFMDSTRHALEYEEYDMSENIQFEIIYSNENFFAYRASTQGYYGGAHEEYSGEQYLFDLKTGVLQNLESLILPSKKSELLSLFNKNLKLQRMEVVQCTQIDGYYDMEFSKDDLKSLWLDENGISLNYWLDYASRACAPIVFIERDYISKYFAEKLFE